MEKGRPMLRWVGILCVSMAVAGFGLNALGGKQESVATKQKGADLISIETLKKFGDLDYPVVQFEHDKHTKAVEGKCVPCSSSGISAGLAPVSLAIFCTCAESALQAAWWAL